MSAFADLVEATDDPIREMFLVGTRDDVRAFMDLVLGATRKYGVRAVGKPTRISPELDFSNGGIFEIKVRGPQSGMRRLYQYWRVESIGD